MTTIRVNRITLQRLLDTVSTMTGSDVTLPGQSKLRGLVSLALTLQQEIDYRDRCRQGGRPRKLSTYDEGRIAKRHAGGSPIKSLAQEYNISPATVHRVVKRQEGAHQ